MARKTVGFLLVLTLFAAGTPLSLADTISQTTDTAAAAAPDLVPGLGVYGGFTYTYSLGSGLSGTLDSLKLKFDGRPGNTWAVEFFCKTGAAFGSAACATSFGNATGLSPATTTLDGTAEYTATWSGANAFEADKFYFFQLRVDQSADGSTPATLSGSADSGSHAGECEAGQSSDGMCAVTDPYFVLEYTPAAPPDTTPPVISNTPADQTVEATAASTTVSYTLPEAFDAVSGTTSVACLPAPGAGFSLGSTTVSCTSADALGNTATSTFVVSVVDTTAPVVTLNGSASTTLTAGESFTDPGASATDLGAAISVSTSGSVDTNTAGSYTLVYSATDASGNAASTTRTVTVEAPPPPPPPPNNGNGPPVPNPAQGLPQGLILGVSTNAVEHASERAVETVSEIFVPQTPAPTAPPAKQKSTSAPAPEPKLNRAEPVPPQTPGDLPAGSGGAPLAAAAAEAEFPLPPWTVFMGILAALLIAALGFGFRPGRE